MYVIECRNVNEALGKGIRLIGDRPRLMVRDVSPRGQRTLEYVGPVATVYEQPRERVLFSAVRDANPFFHFFESLWVLAGWDNVDFVAQFNKGIADFSDDGKYRHGAYGKRLRHFHIGCAEDSHPAGEFDQLDFVINQLKADPASRRAVLQIWDAARDLNTQSKDIPCNDLVFLLVRNGVLDMTVANRSNDCVWGTYGSNAVEFSVLQEYLAAMIGVDVGTYTQVSNSYHAYVDRPDWVKLMNGYITDNRYSLACIAPGLKTVEPYPIVKVPETFDAELQRFLSDPDGNLDDMAPRQVFTFQNPFFGAVAYPLWKAWSRHKSDKDGWVFADQCRASDWRVAAMEWLERRDDHP